MNKNIVSEIFKVVGELYRFYIVFLVIFIFKIIKMYYIAEVNVSLFSLLQGFVYTFLELVPLLILYVFREKQIFNLAYKILAIAIFLLNIASLMYFYNTMESIQPIIFTNLNFYSISGTLLSISLINYIIMILFICIFLYNILFFDKVKKIINKNKIIFLTFNFVIILFSYSFYKFNIPIYKSSGSNYTDVCKFKMQVSATKVSYINLYNSYQEFLINQYKQVANNRIIKKYTDKELAYLTNLGLIKQSEDSKFNILKYKKIVFITFESLSIDFIHYYNNKIPAISYYFDFLLKNNNFLHFDNFYASNMPTQPGLNAIIRGGVNMKVEDDRETIFSYLEKNGYENYLIKGVSKYYGNDNKNSKYLFKAKNRINKEDLEKEYKNINTKGWGGHNNIVYKKAVSIINNSKKPTFVFIKTIDFHQPGMYYGNMKYPSVFKNANRTMRSIFWINKQLELFISKITNKGEIPDDMIIFITADHNPHLGAEYKYYALKDNYDNLAKIPFIVLTSKPIFNQDRRKKLTKINSSQVDILPTFFIPRSNKDKRYSGRNLFGNDSNYSIGFYQNNFYYRSENNKFILDMAECNIKQKRDIRSESICKYLYNTNSI